MNIIQLLTSIRQTLGLSTRKSAILSIIQIFYHTSPLHSTSHSLARDLHLFLLLEAKNFESCHLQEQQKITLSKTIMTNIKFTRAVCSLGALAVALLWLWTLLLTLGDVHPNPGPSSMSSNSSSSNFSNSSNGSFSFFNTLNLSNIYLSPTTTFSVLQTNSISSQQNFLILTSLFSQKTGFTLHYKQQTY